MTCIGDQEIGAVSGRVGTYDFKGLCHWDITVLGQFCDEVTYHHKNCSCTVMKKILNK